MYKLVPSVLIIMLLSNPVSAQIQPAIEKALHDPERKNKEAKADVYAHKKFVIHSTTPRKAAKTSFKK